MGGVVPCFSHKGPGLVRFRTVAVRAPVWHNVPELSKGDGTVHSDRLTRQELTWLLTQEARSAAEKLRKGVDDEQALRIGIECERGSHEFFKKYGERFEDSEGKQIFLEFAEEERAHYELLTREHAALQERYKTGRSRRRAPADSAGSPARSRAGSKSAR